MMHLMITFFTSRHVVTLCVTVEHTMRADLLCTTIGIFVITPINYVIIFPFTYDLPNTHESSMFIVHDTPI